MPGNDQIIAVMFVAIGLLFVSSILLILRFASGVSWKLEVDPGPPLRKSWPGCGSINGVHVGYCGLQVTEYAQGWVIRWNPAWLFGVIWFPKKETLVGPLEPATWYSPQRRQLEVGADSVVLVGQLAGFVTSPAEGKMEAAAEPKPS